MKRILINATHNEEVRVALCKGNHLYDFDLENRTREQKKSNIYKGHVTRVEPSLEAVFVEYGSKRQGFLPIREIAGDYLAGNPREDNIRKLIKEGDELIVQVEKEERGNKGAALSTYVSLAGRYLVLMPNNPKGGGISRQISGKLREDMKRMLGNLDLPKGMSVIIRTAGIGKTQDDLQHDLNHLLNIWQAIQEQNEKYPSPRLVHQEAGVVTRAVRDYLRDDVSEIWIDNEDAFIEAETFVKAVMPTQLEKLRKYTEYEPMFASFGIERQIETAYQREVRLPSGGSIVIDQTEALVAIDINSAKSTKGADVAETAYHTNLEAADEIARQLRLRDMGGLVVIDFIDMSDSKHQKEVEKRLVEATKYDRARVQFGDISRFGLLEMSRQRLRPSLEEATGYICPRCHGNGMIRDLRSLSLSIMRQIEQTALTERHGEVQAEVPTDIAAFLLNEKRESLVYLEQDSGTRITILPHAHLESPNFNLHFNHQGFAPSSYERVTDTQLQESTGRGYEVDWQTPETERLEHQPIRQPRVPAAAPASDSKVSVATTAPATFHDSSKDQPTAGTTASHPAAVEAAPQASSNSAAPVKQHAQINPNKPAAVAWLSNLFAPTPQAKTTAVISSAEAAQAIEAIVNTGAQSRGAFGEMTTTVTAPPHSITPTSVTAAGDTRDTNYKTDKLDRQSQQDGANAGAVANSTDTSNISNSTSNNDNDNDNDNDDTNSDADKERQQRQRARSSNRGRHKYDKKTDRTKSSSRRHTSDIDEATAVDTDVEQPENSNTRGDARQQDSHNKDSHNQDNQNSGAPRQLPKRDAYSKRESRGIVQRGEAQQPAQNRALEAGDSRAPQRLPSSGSLPLNEVQLKINESMSVQKPVDVIHISLDDNPVTAKTTAQRSTSAAASAHSAHAAALTAPSSVVHEASDKESDTGTDLDSTLDNGLNNDLDSGLDNHHEAGASVKKNASSEDVPVAQAIQATQATVDEAMSHPVATTHQPATTSAAALVPATQVLDDLMANEIASPSHVSSGSVQSGLANTMTSANTHVVSDVEALHHAERNSNERHGDSEPVRPQVAASLDASQQDEDSSQVTLGFDTHSLFANRYVTAQKFGQAHNDPRLIKAAMLRLQAGDAQADLTASRTDVAKQTNDLSRGTIGRYTVGEFIHTHLANASLRLQKDGVIRCFLAALSAHRQTSGIEPVTDLTIAAIIPEPVFNFVNYGYEPLSQNYLQQFHERTAAVNRYTVEASKAAISPPAVGVRAANDPRGQHPDYTTPTPSSIAAPDATVDADSAITIASVAHESSVLEGSDNEAQNASAGDAAATARPKRADIITDTDVPTVLAKTPAQAMGELLALNVGDFVRRVLGQEGQDMLASGHTEAAFLQALRQPLDVLLLVAHQRDTAAAAADAEVQAEAQAIIADADSEIRTDIGSETQTDPVHDTVNNDVADNFVTEKTTTDIPIDSVDDVDSVDIVDSVDDVNSEITTEATAVLAPETSAMTMTLPDTLPDTLKNVHDVAPAPAVHSLNKTSIESYKSMIENISEQLLPQTGLLKLSNVKVSKFPKLRGRKVKEEPKEERKDALKTELAELPSSSIDKDEG